MFDWIGFDADDTLWKNEEYYLEGRRRFSQILEKYNISGVDLDLVDDLEVENIQYYGYGVMSFVLSLIELAIQKTDQRIHPSDIQALLDLAKEMLSVDVELYDGVQPLLERLSTSYSLLLITKGDLFHQQRKLRESGLEALFQAVEVVSEKTPQVYQDIFDRHRIEPGHFLMIGNSLRSDILPVLDRGGWAIHLVRHLTWSHEDAPNSEDFPVERLIEVEGIDQVFNALNQLKNRKV